MRVYFSVGEPSGDQHAACLITELQKRCPQLEAVGYGGPAMKAAGCQIRYRLTDLAVMGFLRVLPMLGRFIRLARAASREFREDPPDAVALVDFPGFNWWIARAASRRGIPVFYYMPPQLWAWAPWRIRRVRRFVKHVLCALSFEHDWYAKRGVSATYVGHPFFDEVAEKKLDQPFLNRLSGEGPLVALLPGSRDHEVERNFELIVNVAARIHTQHPTTRFVVAAYNERQSGLAGQILERVDKFGEIEIHTGRTSEIIEAADCCLMVSGSVSLELLARQTPGIVVYRLSRILNFLRPFLMRCPYITLPNLMADREIMPEFVFAEDVEATADKVVDRLDEWLSEPLRLAAARREMQELADAVVVTGATRQAADVVLGELPQARGYAA